MKTLLRWIIALGVIGVTGTGCSHMPERTKFSDKSMRVVVDPEGIDANNYVRIQQALVASGKWIVLDRSLAFKAIQAEQYRLHRSMNDRFEDREKYAIWGRMLGAGGVVVAHTQCQVKSGFWSHYSHCQQSLQLVDSNTTEVIDSAEGDEDSSSDEYELAPSWRGIVAELNDNYPKRFEKNKDTQILLDYKDLAKEEAIRQKEAQRPNKLMFDDLPEDESDRQARLFVGFIGGK
jgi:hypothetical protein